jgi:hypothetical protein
VSACLSAEAVGKDDEEAAPLGILLKIGFCIIYFFFHVLTYGVFFIREFLYLFILDFSVPSLSALPALPALPSLPSNQSSDNESDGLFAARSKYARSYRSC